jgi:hypothetical protein
MKVSRAGHDPAGLTVASNVRRCLLLEREKGRVEYRSGLIGEVDLDGSLAHDPAIGETDSVS